MASGGNLGHVTTEGRLTDAKAWVYNKLTLSGEVKLENGLVCEGCLGFRVLTLSSVHR